MKLRPPVMFCSVEQARAARGEIEAALEDRGWPWSWRLSVWLDALVVLEESGAR